MWSPFSTFDTGYVTLASPLACLIFFPKEFKRENLSGPWNTMFLEPESFPSHTSYPSGKWLSNGCRLSVLQDWEINSTIVCIQLTLMKCTLKSSVMLVLKHRFNKDREKALLGRENSRSRIKYSMFMIGLPIKCSESLSTDPSKPSVHP